MAASVPNLQDATAEQIRTWLYDQGGKSSTVAGRLSAIRSLYRFAVKTERMTRDPSATLDRPRVKRGLPKPVKDLEDKLARLRSPYREIAVLLVETGLRIAEAASLKVPMPPPDQLVILGKGSKERLIPLTAAARAALEALGGHITPSVRTIQRQFRAVGMTPHKLRHTLACDLIASGSDVGDVQKILGHASPATTMVYAAYGQDRLRDALNRRPPRPVGRDPA